MPDCLADLLRAPCGRRNVEQAFSKLKQRGQLGATQPWYVLTFWRCERLREPGSSVAAPHQNVPLLTQVKLLGEASGAQVMPASVRLSRFLAATRRDRSARGIYSAPAGRCQRTGGVNSRALENGPASKVATPLGVSAGQVYLA